MFYSGGGGGNHYEGGQRQYHENSNRGQRGGPNPNYRGKEYPYRITQISMG